MLLVVICGFLAAALLAYALFNRPVPVAQRRLAVLETGRRSGRATAEDERQPRGAVLLLKLRGALPYRQLERLEKLLYAADVSLEAEAFLMIWAGVAVGLPVLYLIAAGSGGGGLTVLAAGAMAGLGAYGPIMLLRSRASRRRKRIMRAMPDMMDLLTTCVEAGLGLDAALARVGDKAKEPLGGEIRATLHSIAMGTSRRQALEGLAARNDVAELTTLVSSLIQTEEMGISLGVTLRVQAEAVRVGRKQRAEQAAQKAPIKIIIVLVLLVFPSMFAVILGPAVIGFVERGGLI